MVTDSCPRCGNHEVVENCCTFCGFEHCDHDLGLDDGDRVLQKEKMVKDLMHNVPYRIIGRHRYGPLNG